jgi:protein-tyrosine phosphatase
MKFGILFLTTATLLIAHAFIHQGFAFLLLWPALCLAIIGGAYLGFGPGVFGKRPDGSMRTGAVLLLFPYLLYQWGLWHLLRPLRKEKPYDELIPGVLIGRRLLPSEFPPGVTLVVDLTSEFPEPPKIRRGRKYYSLPILDGHFPDRSQLKRVLEILASHSGTVYIHCAEGHGRTGTLAAALLLQSGFAQTAQEAIARVQMSRPLVRLHREQREIVDWVEAERKGVFRGR